MNNIWAKTLLLINLIFMMLTFFAIAIIFKVLQRDGNPFQDSIGRACWFFIIMRHFIAILEQSIITFENYITLLKLIVLYHFYIFSVMNLGSVSAFLAVFSCIDSYSTSKNTTTS